MRLKQNYSTKDTKMKEELMEQNGSVYEPAATIKEEDR